MIFWLRGSAQIKTTFPSYMPLSIKYRHRFTRRQGVEVKSTKKIFLMRSNFKQNIFDARPSKSNSAPLRAARAII